MNLLGALLIVGLMALGGLLGRRLLKDESFPRGVWVNYFGKRGPIRIECDVYKSPQFQIHMLCPECHNGLFIDGKSKKIRYRKYAGLFTEPFGCPWDNDTGDMCGARFRFAGKKLKDATA